jgi:hypothetical protein
VSGAVLDALVDEPALARSAEHAHATSAPARSQRREANDITAAAP